MAKIKHLPRCSAEFFFFFFGYYIQVGFGIQFYDYGGYVNIFRALV